MLIFILIIEAAVICKCFCSHYSLKIQPQVLGYFFRDELKHR
jgi:hypothetical protein